MNKRIRELAVEATTWCGHDYDRYGILWEEKFAELIVKECADYITESASIETLLGKKLLEHFGVE